MAIFVAGLAPARSLAAPLVLLQANPPPQKFARKTTDPPIAARGKLGQELFLAIDHRDLAGVKALIDRGADPNSHNGLEFTPLHIAAASHQLDVMKALVGAGAKVESPSPYGTPLTFAALGGNTPGALYLLSKGASVNASRADGITVLMLAARMGDPNLIRELLRCKAVVNAKDNDGATPLIYAAREGNREAGRLLLASGASVDGSDSHRMTPLMFAAVNGHADFVQLLLKKGARPNVRDAKGRTALLLASTYGDHADVVRALLAGGADARVVDARKRTAFDVAVARGHADCSKLLRENGAGSAIDNLAGRRRSPKEAVQASLKLVESSMLTFSKMTGCVSCHQEGLGRIATATARDRGFRIDPAVLSAQEGRIMGGLKALQPLHTMALKDPHAMLQVPLIEINEITTGDSWLLAGMAAHKQPSVEAIGAMAMVLARQQQPDGKWAFTVPRVPMQSSYFTFTALSVRSLQAFAPKSAADEVADRIQKAKKWLLTAPAQTNEDRSSRLLGLKWTGAPEEEIRKAADELRTAQRPDGGWSQLPSLQSDAYATGMALYALHEGGGLSVDDPVYQRGVELLLRTQDEDGSWFVNKRAIPINNYFDSGFPHGESQYASFNGTCWAMMALLQTIEPSGNQSASTER
jgi:ankyrin repeat protein